MKKTFVLRDVEPVTGSNVYYPDLEKTDPGIPDLEKKTDLEKTLKNQN